MPPIQNSLQIEARGIQLAFHSDTHEIRLFDGAEINIRSGTITYLMGESGSGKTKMLQILGALFSPNDGTILWEGTDIGGMPAEALNRWRSQKFAFIFQDLRLIDDLTGRENILFPLKLQRKHPHEIEKAFSVNDEYHRLLEINHFWNRKLTSLSGGERQRIAIARALITKPEVILADEPTSNLNKSMAENVNHIFEMERQKGTAVVIVTHDDRQANIIKEHRRLYRIDTRKKTLISPQKSNDGYFNDSSLKNPCPRCGTNTAPVEWIQQRVENTPVIIDVCPECKGVWLDSGEWEHILSFPNSIIEKLEEIIEQTRSYENMQ